MALGACFGVMLAAADGALAQSRPGPVIAVEGGSWYDGARFVKRTFYIEDGRLLAARPARVDSVLDVAGGFVVPPLGDAHTHNLDGSFGLDAVRDAYLAEGTFYVAVLTNTTSGARQVRDSFTGRCSLDVIYANGGVTSTLSHPFLAYEPRAMGLFTDWEAHAAEIRASRKREGDAYWFVDSARDLDRVWPDIRAAGPDVIKIFLLDAAEVDPDTTGSGLPHGRGLRPSLVPDVVRRAHDAGLRVAAHVETAADFDVAVPAGVEIIAHMPGYQLGATPDGGVDPSVSSERFEISDRSAREAGRRGVVVTPTVAWTYVASGPDSARVVARRHALMRRNLTLLREHGVRVVIGSDWYGDTAWREVEALRRLGLMSDAELLRAWAVDTPQAIFPDRALGAFEPGFEASFLVLEEDPTESLDALRDVRLRVKQGCVLETQ